jgi:hypothetical protein
MPLILISTHVLAANNSCGLIGYGTGSVAGWGDLRQSPTYWNCFNEMRQTGMKDDVLYLYQEDSRV